MIEQSAIIIKLDGRYALVEAQRQSSCGQCNAKKGCGTGMLENSLGRRAMQIRALNQCQAQLGDEVVVAVPETGFIKSAIFTYLLPLIMMLVGGLLVQNLSNSYGWGNEDAAALLGAALGFGLSLLLLRRYSRKMEQRPELHPVIIRKTHPTVSLDIGKIQRQQHPF